MSTVFWVSPTIKKPVSMAVAIVGLLFVTGCSTDVQRFGQTGAAAPTSQMGAPNSVASLPLSPLQSNANAAGSPPGAQYAATRRITGPRPGPDGTIRVGTGDTLYSISRANGIRVEDLAAANGIKFPYHVRFGQRVRLPGATNRVVAASTPVVPPTAYAPVAPRATAHVVQPKETLYSVARRYQINVRDLAAANSLTLSSGLQIGQRLTIPNGSVKAQRTAALGGPLIPVAPGKIAKKAPAKVAVAVRASLPAPALAAAPKISPVATVKTVSATGPLAEPPSRASRQFRWPVRGRLISRFGLQPDGRRSDGVNISVPEGTSVKAAENGVIAYVGSELKGYGKLVLIRHSGDWVTAYAHNSQILVERGDTVKRGQIIAKAGKTGSVTKPQVHFQVRKGAKAVDPLNYLEGA